MSEPTGYQGMSCDEFAEMAAELALGVLTGRERAAALAHLDTCESCRELVRELTMTGEELLALLPSREPPAGFETRVLDRIGVSASTRPKPGPRRRASHRVGRGTDRPTGDRPPGRPRTRIRGLLTAAAVAVALVIAGIGGWGLRDATAPSAPSASVPLKSSLSTATLFTSAHENVGTVFVYQRSPRWMNMSVNLEAIGDMAVTCQLENAAGQFTTVGNFRLSAGYGSWASPYDANGTVVGARLLRANGTVLATASFT
jgi:anti-sigma-K factor RskA